MKSRTFFIFWPLLVWLVLLSPNALRAEVDENALWSLQLKDASISEALKQITQTTGIKIIPPSRLGNRVITRSYKNQTIEHILKDLFRDMNYALVWSHGEKGIDSVRILALDKVGTSGDTHSSDAVRPTLREYPAARYPAQRQLPPKRGLTPPKKSTEESEPEDPDSEVSPEQEQEEDKQPETESKEESKEEMGFSEGSDEDVEKGAGEPPSVVEQSEGEKESGSSSPDEEERTGEQ